MAFKLALSPTFWATAKTELPAEDSKQPIVAVIQVQYKRLGMAELKAFVERIQGEQVDDIAVAREVMTDWRDVTGDDDQPLDFNPHNRDQLLDAGFAASICKAFFANQPKAKEKN